VVASAQSAAGFLRGNKVAVRFLLLFILFFGVLYFVFGVIPGVRLGLIQPYTVLLAKAVAWITNLFGEGAFTEANKVVSDRFSLTVAMGCDGVEASCLFLAGVLAFPTARKAKLIGIAFGIPLIHLLNLTRLVALYYAGIYFPASFEELHVYVAQTVIILLTTGILIYWLDRFGTRYRSI
jgi:exosortase H (IPTLxxWG-CTERM-specific)